MMALTCHLPPCKISWSLANAYQREGTILHSCILQSAVGTCKWISRCRWHSEDTVASKMQSRISNCMHKYVLMCAAPPIGMILESVFSSLGVLDRRCVWRFIASANNGGGVVWCINVNRTFTLKSICNSIAMAPVDRHLMIALTCKMQPLHAIACQSTNLKSSGSCRKR